MEISKLTKQEIRGLDRVRLKEAELEVRRKLAMLRLDTFDEQRKQAGQVRGLKKSLARILTSETALGRNQTK